jgi:hypothetical protein
MLYVSHCFAMTKGSASVLLYIIAAGYVADDIAVIGVVPDPDALRVSLFGVPVRDMALLLALCCLAVRHRQMLRTVPGRWLFLIIVCFLAGLVQGISSRGMSRDLNYDIRVFLWLFGGIGFALVMERTRQMKLHLTLLLLLSTILMACASLFSPSHQEVVLTGGRVTHPSLFAFGGLLLVPLILVTNVSGSRLRDKLIPVCCLAAFFAFGAFLSDTRSFLIIGLVSLLILLASLRFRFKNGAVTIGSTTRVAKVVVFSVALMMVVSIPSMLTPLRAARFATLLDPKLLLANERVLELIEFYSSSDSKQLLIGRGVGGALNSPIFGGELTGSMHIGIVNVWMKFGLLPFAIAAGFFLLVVPIRYVRSFRNLQDSTIRATSSDTANVVVLPSLFPWIVGMLISGGYSEGNLWSAGFVFYVYCDVKRFGLDALFSRSYQAREIPARDGTTECSILNKG